MALFAFLLILFEKKLANTTAGGEVRTIIYMLWSFSIDELLYRCSRLFLKDVILCF